MFICNKIESSCQAIKCTARLLVGSVVIVVAHASTLHKPCTDQSTSQMPLIAYHTVCFAIDRNCRDEHHAVRYRQ